MIRVQKMSRQGFPIAEVAVLIMRYERQKYARQNVVPNETSYQSSAYFMGIESDDFN